MRGFLSRIGWLVLLTIGLTFIGCGPPKTSDKNLRFINIADAQSLAAKGPDKAIWVDPRPGREFREGHIPDAVNISLAQVETQHWQLKNHGTIIVYGNTGRDALTIAMSKSLIELGYDVRTLDGGIRAWEAAGNELD